MLVFNIVGNLFVEIITEYSFNLPIHIFTSCLLSCHWRTPWVDGRYIAQILENSNSFFVFSSFWLFWFFICQSLPKLLATDHCYCLMPTCGFRYLKLYDYAFYHLCHIYRTHGWEGQALLFFCFVFVFDFFFPLP